MMYKAEVAVCSDSHTKHKRNVINLAEVLNVKHGGT